MASLDPRVASVLDRRSTHAVARDDSDDEDALIAALEDDSDGEGGGALATLREQRREQLHAELTRARVMRETSHGTYTEIKDEKQVLDITTSEKLAVVHFMKPDFGRCRVMDDKLRVLAEKHFDTRFVSVNVDNAPFLVVKLGIKVLPCVIAFVDGVGVDRVVGFEGLGRRPDAFTTAELEARLLRCGVLVRAKMTEDDERLVGRREVEEKEYDSDDWD